MKKSVLIGLVALGIVSFASYKAGQRSVVKNDSSEAIETQVKEDLINLTKKDFEEYQNLKTMEDRYKKADEILGKIVTVFLADLSVKLAYKPSNPAMLEGACAIPGLNTTPTPTPTPEQSQMSVAQATATSTPETKLAVPGWIQSEKKIASMRNEEEALEQLRKNPIEDIFDTLKATTVMSRKDALDIDGRFEGEINFFDKKKHKTDWIVYWEVNLSGAGGNNKPASGRALITLTNKSDGKTFSRSSGSNTLKDFVRAPGSNALIINVYGDDGYIQIYPIGDKDHWVGNYYEKVKMGQYNFAGQVRINRL